MHTSREVLTMVLVYVFIPTECLLNQESVSDSSMAKVVEELQQNVTTLSETFEKKYNDLKTENAELRRNLTTEPNLSGGMEYKSNATSVCQRLTNELERKINRSLSAYQVILHDIIDNRNNQSLQQGLSQKFVDLTKEFRYVSLTVLDVQKLLTNQSNKILQQHHRISQLERELLVQNLTIADLQTKIREQNRTLTEKGQEVSELGIQIKNQSQAILDHQLAIETIPDQKRKILEIEAQQFKENQTIMNQQSEIRVMEEDVKILAKNYSDQQTFTKVFIGTQNRMNESLAAHRVILHDLVDRFNEQASLYDNRTHDLNRSMTDLGKQFHYLSLSVLDSEKKLAQLNATLSAQLTNVAFTVSASSYHTDWRNTKVVYDKVITNIGSGYSLQTGIFTCPRDGDYVFTWSTMSNSGGQNCYAFIYRNGVRSLETFSEENGGSIYEHASTTVVFHLSMGDKVWIQTSGCVYFQGYPYTAFSGWKL